MAIALIWISFYHMYYEFPNKAFAFLLNKIGYGGNDIFFFLSSFGLYFAYKKNSNYVDFIKRRFKRILPVSIPTTIITCLYLKYGIKDIIIKTLGLTIFANGDRFGWFVSTILIFYLFTPIYLKVFNKKPLICTVISFLFSLLIGILCFGNILYVMMVSKLPIYLLGFYFGYLTNIKKEFNKLTYMGFVLLMIIGFVLLWYCFRLGDMLWFNGLYYYPFFFIVPGFVLIASYIIEKIPFLQKPLDFIGGYTFEHIMLFELVTQFIYSLYSYFYIPINGFDLLFNLFIVLVNFLLAILYKKLIDFIQNVRIKKRGI